MRANDFLMDVWGPVVFDWPTKWAKGRCVAARLFALVLYLAWFILLMPFTFLMILIIIPILFVQEME